MRAPPSQSDESAAVVREALLTLGIRRLVLAIHDQSFPSVGDEDVGRGSPYGQGARELLAFVSAAGFDGVQLGPQGDTELDNPSPYDGALFTKSPMSIALATLIEDGDFSLIGEDLLAPAVAGRPAGPPDRVQYRYAWLAARQTLATLHARFSAARAQRPASAAPLAARFAEFQRHRAAAFARDGVFEALVAEHGTPDWRRWPTLDATLFCPSPSVAADAARRHAELRAGGADHIERHAFGQFILAEQHARLRRGLASARAPLALLGDMAIGFSHRDIWSRRSLFRGDYVMGAPPSRTNPDGQPWGFPVLDPEQYFADPGTGAPGPVLELLVSRVDGMLAELDGLRIDHPHGLVCPWVYRADALDPGIAVARGARLFCSPDVPEHPGLRRFAIPTPDQLAADVGIARYADDWVRVLDDDQVTRYGVLLDAILARVRAAGRSREDVLCEVLSTCPYPLRRVMERHGLGRFRVLQKADLGRDDDVYRAENAAEHDWIMLGNHDTPPISVLAEAWHGSAAGARWATYLAERLMPSPAARPRFARWVAADARHLTQSLFATLFASRARRVSVFFADFFGLRESYNRPGTVNADNWTLRLPPDWHARHVERVRRLDAVNLPLALALAGCARPGKSRRDLVVELLREARLQTPLLDGEIASIILDTTADAASG